MSGKLKKLNMLFEEFVSAHADLEKAKKKIKVGEISSDELFDIEYYFVEKQQQFIKELKKVAWNFFMS